MPAKTYRQVIARSHDPQPADWHLRRECGLEVPQRCEQTARWNACGSQLMRGAEQHQVLEREAVCAAFPAQRVHEAEFDELADCVPAQPQGRPDTSQGVLGPTSFRSLRHVTSSLGPGGSSPPQHPPTWALVLHRGARPRRRGRAPRPARPPCPWRLRSPALPCSSCRGWP